MSPEASDPPPHTPAPTPNTVRVEVRLHGETFVHDVRTDVFLEGVTVHRRADQMYWSMDVIRMAMRRASAREFLSHTLLMLDDDDKWAIIEPILDDLERRGFRFRDRA